MSEVYLKQTHHPPWNNTRSQNRLVLQLPKCKIVLHFDTDSLLPVKDVRLFSILTEFLESPLNFSYYLKNQISSKLWQCEPQLNTVVSHNWNTGRQILAFVAPLQYDYAKYRTVFSACSVLCKSEQCLCVPSQMQQWFYFVELHVHLWFRLLFSVSLWKKEYQVCLEISANNTECFCLILKKSADFSSFTRQKQYMDCYNWLPVYFHANPLEEHRL